MKTKSYLILTASAFLLLLTAVNATLAQNHAGRFLNVIDRITERRAATRTEKTAQLEINSANSSPAAPGDLDSTFGTGGKVVTVLPDDNFTQKMAIQPDGKIVVQGRGFTLSGDLATNFLARYNPNGTLDSSFGTNGTVIIPYAAAFEDFQNGLAILPDGKILVSGDVYKPATQESDFAVFRFNANGSRDTSFGVNGTATAPIGASDDYGYTLRVQPDGKIVVVGFVRKADPFTSDVGAARFNADGTIDTAFGTNGKLTIAIPTNTNFALAFHFEILPDGKLLLIGRTTDENIFTRKVFLSRINSNGTLDASFGTNGILLPEFNQLENFVSQFALQPDGKIVFPTGNFSGGTFQSSTVVRLNSNGSLDASFGTNGTAVIPASDGNFSRAIVIQPNGKILAARKTVGSAPFRFAVLRLNADGSRDTTFGANGIVTTLLAAFDNLINDMALQPDGKLVAYGDTGDSATGEYDIGLARYNLAAPRPTQFDFEGDGRADISVFRAGTWYRLDSSNNSFSGAQFGAASDRIVPADYDGDARSDIAVFRSGVWYILQSSTNTLRGVAFGQASDVPVPGDYDGDGKADVAVFRGGFWYVLNSGNNSFRAEQFGNATDKPIVGDFDADGRQDLAVFRNGTWYVNRSTAGFYAAQFGLASDKPVAADYDGDFKIDLAVFRGGDWYILQSSNNQFRAVSFGFASDVPVAADYDGDGRADVAVFRSGNWFVLNSQNNSVRAVSFGQSSDTPIQTAYLP